MSVSDHVPGWPDGMILAQHETERLLLERALELGVRIRWGAALVGLHQDERGVELSIDSGSEWTTLRCDYVIGCDGGRSAVRTLAGIPFPGEDATSHWIVADARLTDPPHEPFLRTPVVGMAQVSQTEPDWHRVSVPLLSPPTDRSAAPTIEELRTALVRGLQTDFGLSDIRWVSRFTDAVHHAAQYRQGPVFLAGDAAHTHSPIGGQGLNLGIQDAVNLGWKLAAVLSGGPEILLDTYHCERHPVGAAAISMTKAQTALLKPGLQVDALRTVVGRMLATPEVCVSISTAQSGLGVRYGDDDHPLMGRRVPNLGLIEAGCTTRLFDLLHDAKFLLLNFGDHDLGDVAQRWHPRLRYVQGRLDDNTPAQWIPGGNGVRAPQALLVRPDGYIAWLRENDEPIDVPGLTTAITEWMGAGCRPSQTDKDIAK